MGYGRRRVGRGSRWVIKTETGTDRTDVERTVSKGGEGYQRDRTVFGRKFFVLHSSNDDSNRETFGLPKRSRLHS